MSSKVAVWLHSFVCCCMKSAVKYQNFIWNKVERKDWLGIVVCWLASIWNHISHLHHCIWRVAVRSHRPILYMSKVWSKKFCDIALFSNKKKGEVRIKPVSIRHRSSRDDPYMLLLCHCTVQLVLAATNGHIRRTKQQQVQGLYFAFARRVFFVFSSRWIRLHMLYYNFPSLQSTILNRKDLLRFWTDWNQPSGLLLPSLTRFHIACFSDVVRCLDIRTHYTRYNSLVFPEAFNNPAPVA